MNESQVISLIQIAIGIFGLCITAYLSRKESREIEKRNQWLSEGH